MTTSFNDYSKQQLAEAATRFNITVDNRWSKATIVGHLLEAGVDPDEIKSMNEILDATEGEDVAPPALDAVGEGSEEDGGKQVILKMERPNRSYSIMGHRFESSHPFVIMDEEEAFTIMELADGFRIAHPKEAAKFYKEGK